jgi:hypothetical protein
VNVVADSEQGQFVVVAASDERSAWLKMAGGMSLFGPQADAKQE